MHDDLLFIAPNGSVITKQMDLDSHKKGEMIVKELISKVEKVKLINDTAVVIIVYDTKGTMLGNPIQGKFQYIRVWKSFNDELKIIAGSCFQLS